MCTTSTPTKTQRPTPDCLTSPHRHTLRQGLPTINTAQIPRPYPAPRHTRTKHYIHVLPCKCCSPQDADTHAHTFRKKSQTQTSFPSASPPPQCTHQPTSAFTSSETPYCLLLLSKSLYIETTPQHTQLETHTYTHNSELSINPKDPQLLSHTHPDPRNSCPECRPEPCPRQQCGSWSDSGGCTG